jgi:NAD(P)-dependent dehydrogenase (short-subunit alcohol dehydrogenase family)
VAHKIILTDRSNYVTVLISRYSDGASRTVLDHTALNRWGRPAELAGAFQYLASDAAEFVTGTVLNVDGGYLLA